MVWYGMVNVDLYSAIITKVSNATSDHALGKQAVEKVQLLYCLFVPHYPVDAGYCTVGYTTACCISIVAGRDYFELSAVFRSRHTATETRLP